MKLNRRDFIKRSAATGGVVLTAASVSDAGAQPATNAMTEAKAQPKSPGKGTWIPTVCQGCTSWCPAEGFVQDGRVVKVRGHHLSKSNNGYVCPRGHMGVGQMYDPDRVKVPMKRTNPQKGRGVDPKFVPISWDEALGTIADKMMELRQNGEPEKFMLMRGRYTYLPRRHLRRPSQDLRLAQQHLAQRDLRRGGEVWRVLHRRLLGLPRLRPREHQIRDLLRGRSHRLEPPDAECHSPVGQGARSRDGRRRRSPPVGHGVQGP